MIPTNQRPTPETDAQIEKWRLNPHTYKPDDFADFARKLEQQRDETFEDAKRLANRVRNDHKIGGAMDLLKQQRDALREALESIESCANGDGWTLTEMKTCILSYARAILAEIEPDKSHA